LTVAISKRCATSCHPGLVEYSSQTFSLVIWLVDEVLGQQRRGDDVGRGP
jgi:hypothetical protein